ncbi:tripartite tricarboxylate transporter substrate binding protein [Xenophilus arseniciresistens]|uniref:Tripartite tricarboxylate transporter substrate binding protein n=1 Tax=Xenophilus arseniciresistens TaxID=1283306 RepID=A0AAE3NCT3_9BURK|nr:tripartite tricarboxylate transporter substrate binding protein [Xenophilus arseniciresistens]MDA7419208.1 tripartite tricarboxylate transporter substrate binding protein [Xenophilus arseniciresistens]
MNLNRRQTLGALASLGTLGIGAFAPAAAQASAPAYPNSVIKFVIPTPAGGGHDTMMRLIGQKLSDAWGQPCIVESRPGASGAIAASAVSQSAPDGHTVLVGYSALLSNTVLMPKPGYRLEELKPVGMLALTPIAIGIREGLPVATLEQFVALAKSRAGKVSYGSYGQGSGGHFVGELFNMAAGVETVHVPYKGEAPALQDLLGGQIDAAVVSVGGVNRYPGRIKPLAVAGSARFPAYPQLPTFAELGYPQVDMPGWAAAFVPAKTPQAVVDKLSAELARILVMPDIRDKLLELGFEPQPWNAQRTQRFMDEQLALTRRLVDAGRVKL